MWPRRRSEGKRKTEVKHWSEGTLEAKMKHWGANEGDRFQKNMATLDVTSVSKWREAWNWSQALKWRKALKWREAMKARYSFEVKETVETRMKHWREIEGDRFKKTWSHSMWARRRSEGRHETKVKHWSEVEHWSEGKRWNRDKACYNMKHWNHDKALRWRRALKPR